MRFNAIIIVWFHITYTSIAIHTIQEKKSNGNKNIKKTFSIKVKEDVGVSKPKKDANKVGRLTWDPKLNKPLPYNPT